MPETHFQALYNQYLLSRELSDAKLKEKCLQQLHSYVYSYPLKRYLCDEDTASEFYLFIFRKIEGFFEDYQADKQVNFLAFVAVKVRFAFLKFQEKRNTYAHTLERQFTGWQTELTGNEVLPETGGRTSGLQQKLSMLMREVFQRLDASREIPVRLYYGFPLQLSHFRLLLKQNGNLAVFQHYRDYLITLKSATTEQKQEKEKVMERLQLVYLSLLDKQKQASIQEEEELKARHRKLIDEYFRIKSTVTLKTVARILNKSILHVHRRIVSATKTIKDYLMDKMHELQSALSGPMIHAEN